MADPGIGENAQGMIMHEKLPEGASQYLGVPKLANTDHFKLKTFVAGTLSGGGGVVADSKGYFFDEGEYPKTKNPTGSTPSVDTKYLAVSSIVKLNDKAPEIRADLVYAEFDRGDHIPTELPNLEAGKDRDYLWNRTLIHYDDKGRVVATTEAVGCGDKDLTGGELKRVQTLAYTPDGSSREITTYTKDGSQWREEKSSNQPYFVNDAGVPNNARSDRGKYLNSTSVAQAA